VIELGKKVRDKITGFEGIADSRHIYLHGCDRYSVTTLVEGKPVTEAFDEGSLEVIDEGIKAEEVKADKPGGPRFIPERR
jgi:hypothetical protein